MNTCTRRLNTRHGHRGWVFGDRHKSVLIELPEHAGKPDHLRTVIGYVHLNPVRAALLKPGTGISEMDCLVEGDEKRCECFETDASLRGKTAKKAW